MLQEEPGLHDGAVIQQWGRRRPSRCNGRWRVFRWHLRCNLHYCISTYIFVSRKNEGLLLFRSDAVRTCRPIKRSIFLTLRETWMFGVGASCFQQRIMASDFHSSFFTLAIRGQSQKAERDGVKNFQNTEGHPDCSLSDQHCRKLPACNSRCEELEQ